MSTGTVLFDLDGTLTDSRDGITRCIRFALESLGRSAPEADQLHWCIGPPLRASLARLMAGADEADVDRALALYRQRFGEVGLYENRVIDGVPEMLAALRASGFRLLLATAKPTVFAGRIVEHFGFDAWLHGLYGSELDGRLTDKRDLIRHIVACEGLGTSMAAMVGDRREDLAGASDSGLLGIGVTYGFGSEAELAEADILCDSPAEVVEALCARLETVSR